MRRQLACLGIVALAIAAPSRVLCFQQEPSVPTSEPEPDADRRARIEQQLGELDAKRAELARAMVEIDGEIQALRDELAAMTVQQAAADGGVIVPGPGYLFKTASRSYLIGSYQERATILSAEGYWWFQVVTEKGEKGFANIMAMDISDPVISAAVRHLNEKAGERRAAEATAEAEVWVARIAAADAAEAEVTKAAQEAARKAEVARCENATHSWGARIGEIVCARKIAIGMTAGQVKASWGEPEDVNRTITGSGTSEQWVYAIGSYVYFDGGVVTAIQN